MKKSIGKRLIKNFLLIIIIVVFTISFFLIYGFKEFYYNVVKNELENRIVVSIDSFNKFYSDKDIDDLLIEDTDLFWSHFNSEVQIIDLKGFVVYDTIGALPIDKLDNSEFENLSDNKIISQVGSNKYTDERTMSVTGSLKNQKGNIIGYIRFISSMEDVDKAIIKTSLTIIFFGLFVIFITAIISLILARSIVKPIIELKAVAEKMADGQYKVRSTLQSNDELGQLAKTLNVMAEEIVKKEQIKNDFISSISHELRTPLTSIKGWAVVLKSAKDDEKELVSDGLNIIEKESDRLSKMVEDLLDFSRFISGRIHLEKDAFNIEQTCRDVSKQMRPRAEANKVEFIEDIEDEKTIIIGDENRIRQILINLIDNAIKFTSKDGWVKFKAFREHDNYNILVSDNGLGISKEDLAHVKEKFYKGKHSKSHSGIGLSISDEIAKLHGGTLDIYSEENIGTTVKVTIPIPLKEKENEDE